MQVLRNFLNDRGGNFAIMFSFVALPVLLGVGIAVDYANLLRIKDALQSSADAAVLAVAQKGDSISDSQADVIGDGFLDGNFDPQYTNLTVVRLGTEVRVNANTKVAMAFGGMIGLDLVDVNVASTADVAQAGYEIALALDTTGSMAGGKLQSMKDAVETMVDNMALQNPTSGSLKFSVVPFSSMVNVGQQFGPTYGHANTVTQQPAAWLDSLAQSPIVQADLDPGVSRFALYKHLGMAWTGCVEARPVFNGVDYGTNDVTPNGSLPETLFVPAFASDDNDTETGPNGYLADNGTPIGAGTVTDRMARYGAFYAPAFKSMTFSQQISNSATWINRNPNFSQQSYYSNYPVNMGPDFGCDVQSILPLTTNFAAVKAKVNSLVALGSTNIVEGTVWGWRTLSPGAPFTEGAAVGKIGIQKILVVLTDGTNNLGQLPNSRGSAYSSYGYLTDGRLGINSGSFSQVSDQMNAKTLEVCDNAKAAGIEIYTIRLEEPNVTTGNMLQDCASSPANYLDVPNRALLDDAFAKIAKKIVRVRLAS